MGRGLSLDPKENSSNPLETSISCLNSKVSLRSFFKETSTVNPSGKFVFIENDAIRSFDGLIFGENETSMTFDSRGYFLTEAGIGRLVPILTP